VAELWCRRACQTTCPSGQALVARTADKFADSIVRLYQDSAPYKRVREKGLDYVRTNHDPERLRVELNQILDALESGD
jgi:hypothetical protein